MTRAETLLPEVRAAFGRRLRELRTANDLTQLELGILVGMGESSIGTIERGDPGCNPTLNNLLRFVSALELSSLEDLFVPLSSRDYSRVVWHADAAARADRLRSSS